MHIAFRKPQNNSYMIPILLLYKESLKGEGRAKLRVM